MKIRFLLSTTLSVLIIIVFALCIIECIEALIYGCASDSKLVFAVVSFLLILVGILRVFILFKIKLSLLIKCQDFFYIIFLLPLIYVESIRISMGLGILLFILFIIISVMSIFITKKRWVD